MTSAGHRDYYAGLHVNGEPMKENLYGVLPHSGLDERGQTAATLWTDGTAQSRWAAALRSGEHLDDKLPGGDRTVEQATADLDHAIAQGTLAEDTTLWRGIVLAAGSERAFQPGTEVSDPSYLATSFHRRNAQDMSAVRKRETPGSQPWLIQINAPAGTNAAPGAEMVSEAVLARGSRLRILSQEPGKNGEPGLIVADLMPDPGMPAGPTADLSGLGDDDLETLAHQLTTADDFDEPRLLAVLDEIGRRDAQRAVDPSTDDERRVDDLMSRGWSYIDAYAEVHAADERQMHQQENAALVERRKGESFQRATRRAYQQWVAQRYIEAETATRGHMLVPASRARGIDPVSLFSGPSARARKHASDDLKAWWEANGGRVTFGEFLARMAGDRATAQQARMAGNGKDFGV